MSLYIMFLLVYALFPPGMCVENLGSGGRGLRELLWSRYEDGKRWLDGEAEE